MCFSAGILLYGHHSGLPVDHGRRRVHPRPKVPVHRWPGAAGQRVPDGRPVSGEAGRRPPETAQTVEQPAPSSAQVQRRHHGDQQRCCRGRPTERNGDNHYRRDYTIAEHLGSDRREHVTPTVSGKRLPVCRPEGQRVQLQRQQPSLRNGL